MQRRQWHNISPYRTSVTQAVSLYISRAYIYTYTCISIYIRLPRRQSLRVVYGNILAVYRSGHSVIMQADYTPANKAFPLEVNTLLLAEINLMIYLSQQQVLFTTSLTKSRKAPFQPQHFFASSCLQIPFSSNSTISLLSLQASADGS